MSVDLQVFLRRSAMPTPRAWLNAIVDHGFKVELDTDFDVETFTGFLPCKYAGEDAGFEYYSHRLSKTDRAELDLLESYDFAVTFVTHSDLREFVSSLICAGVLCKVSDGTLLDPQSGESYTAENVLEFVLSQIAECCKDLD